MHCFAPGGTGSGKTRLALWYRLHGFKLASDEIVTVSINPGGKDQIVIDGVLARPLMVKCLADASPLLRPNELARCADALFLRFDGQARRQRIVEPEALSIVGSWSFHVLFRRQVQSNGTDSG